MILPRALRHGARIALVAPAGPLPEGGLERAVKRVQQLGWEPIVGRNAGRRHGYLAGTDSERLADLSQALSSEDNEGIWCLRGGYGGMRLLPALDLTPLIARPRPVIGFSDNTALHLAIQRIGVVSFHGPHPAVTELPPFALRCLRKVLDEAKPAGVLPFPSDAPGRATTIVAGAATGPLVGGNLSLLAATVGTPYQLDLRGAILFFEDIGEAAYRLDRLLTQFLLGGVLQGVSGIAIGAITDRPDAGDPEIPSIEAVLEDRLGGLGVPVAYGFPFGHIPENWTLPLGISARLDASAGTLEIREAAVCE